MKAYHQSECKVLEDKPTRCSYILILSLYKGYRIKIIFSVQIKAFFKGLTWQGVTGGYFGWVGHALPAASSPALASNANEAHL